jgi:hypothetical protein
MPQSTYDRLNATVAACGGAGMRDFHALLRSMRQLHGRREHSAIFQCGKQAYFRLRKRLGVLRHHDAAPDPVVVQDRKP